MYKRLRKTRQSLLRCAVRECLSWVFASDLFVVPPPPPPPPPPHTLLPPPGPLQCMAPTYVGDFALKGADLRKRGLNRIGNMLGGSCAPLVAPTR